MLIVEGDIETLLLLLRAGSDPDAKHPNTGQTAIHMAREPTVLELLLGLAE